VDTVGQDRAGRRTGGVAARRTEDGDEDAEAECTADLLDDVQQTGGGAGVFRCDVGDGPADERDEEHAGAEAEDDHRSDHVGQVAARLVQPGQPERAGGDQYRAEQHQTRAVDPVEHPRDDAGRGEEQTGHRQERQAGGERAQLEHALQVLGEEEEHPEHRADHQQHGQVRRRAGRGPEEPQRDDRVADAALDQHERDQQHHTGAERDQCLGRGPADLGDPDEAVDERADAERRRDRTGDVEPAGLTVGLGQHPAGRDDQTDSDRDVDEQTPAPGGPVGQHAAEDQADAAAAGRDQAVVAQGLHPLGSFAIGEHHQGQRRGRCDGATDALQDPGGEQELGVRGETAEQGSEREDADTGDEDPAAAEQVTGTGAEQKQTAEGQGVGVLHPGQAGRAEVESVLDLGHCDVHHGRIQDHHQLGDQDDRENNPGSPGGRA